MPAGWGTDHLGQGACKLHGGNTKGHSAKNLRQTLNEELSLLHNFEPTLGRPRKIDPHTAVLQEIHRTAGHIEWLLQRIQELGLDPETPEGTLNKSIGENRVLHQWTNLGIKPSVWIDMYQHERTHLLQACKAAVAMGVAERQISLAEGQGKMIAAVLLAFIKDRSLALTPEQRALAPELARKYLTEVPAQQGYALPLETQATEATTT